MKTNKIIYWASTGLLCLLFFAGALMYIFVYPRAEGFFTNLGFPTWIIYPLAIAKILAVVAVLSKRSQLLKEWAYAGFFFDALLALVAHIMASDGEYMPALLSIILVMVSRIFETRVYESKSKNQSPLS